MKRFMKPLMSGVLALALIMGANMTFNTTKVLASSSCYGSYADGFGNIVPC